MIARPVFGVAVLFTLLCSCGDETPPPQIQAEKARSQVIFRDISDEVGLDFHNYNGMIGEKYFVEMTGSGGGMFDYDNDGDLDLYLIHGRHLGNQTEGTETPVHKDRLYRNDLRVLADGTRELSFTDVTDESGLEATGYGMGLAVGDVNNDGHLDLFVTNWGPNQLWRNNGDGTFSNITQPGITDDPRWTTSASFLDFDRDGWLDLMSVNYVAYRIEEDHLCFATRSGVRDYCGPMSYDPETDRLLRNRGDGTFEDVTLRMGLAGAYGAGLGVISADFNQDGWTDILVANDGMDNRMWLNQAGTRFEDQAVVLGTAVNQGGAAEASMGVVSADFDNDGDEDVFMTHLNGETNTFYENTGDGLFEDRTRISGLGRASWSYTAFGTGAIDFDQDGLLDIFIANGDVRILEEQVNQGDPLPLKQPNLLFRNVDGRQFDEVEGWAGDLTDIKEVSRGVALGDIDNDGATDILLFNNNGPARLLHNEAAGGRSWIGLHLLDVFGRDAIGARAAFIRSDGTALWRRSHTDGSFCSSKDPRIRFGLGDDPSYDQIRIFWSDGTVEEYSNLETGTYHTLTQGRGP